MHDAAESSSKDADGSIARQDRPPDLGDDSEEVAATLHVHRDIASAEPSVREYLGVGLRCANPTYEIIGAIATKLCGVNGAQRSLRPNERLVSDI